MICFFAPRSDSFIFFTSFAFVFASGSAGSVPILPESVNFFFHDHRLFRILCLPSSSHPSHLHFTRHERIRRNWPSNCFSGRASFYPFFSLFPACCKAQFGTTTTWLHIGDSQSAETKSSTSITRVFISDRQGRGL